MMNILVFGGNGFIGSETVQVLLQSGVTVTAVNRGKSWDWDKMQSIKPHVDCVMADRDLPLEKFQELVDLVNTQHFHAVVDFSGYDSFALKESTCLLRGRTDLYIYISSDSVYEVCLEKSHFNQATKESDCLRPASKESYKKLKRRDSYGHDKLKCEEVLAKQASEGGIPYVCLRLADVIGARDSTERWWQYQLWVTMANQTDCPVIVSSQLKDKPISLVYVKDVAQIIGDIISGRSKYLANQAYNLAFSEVFTVMDLIEEMASCLDPGGKVRVEYSDSDDITQIYPSVENGPIDISKACEVLNWKPTPFKLAVREIVRFYTEIHKGNTFTDEKKNIYRTLKKDLKYIYGREAIRKLKDILFIKEK